MNTKRELYVDSGNAFYIITGDHYAKVDGDGGHEPVSTPRMRLDSPTRACLTKREAQAFAAMLLDAARNL